MDENHHSLTSNIFKNVLQPSDDALDGSDEQSDKYYLRQVTTLQERALRLVPRNNAVKRFLEFGIIPRKKYTVDVYFEIAELFEEGKSPEDIVKYLHKQYSSLKEAKISAPFVKNALQLINLLLVPEMVRLVPEGPWSLMMDGTARTSDGMIMFLIAAVPLQPKEGEPDIVPLVAAFIPSENKDDIKEILHDLKPKLPSNPVSIISDFRAGIIDAVGEIFPESVKQGCHYHIIEIIAKIMIYPLIRKIKKKLNPTTSGLIRWAHHSLYGKQSDNLMLAAESIKKVCTSNGGRFGANFLEFCDQMKALIEWAHERQEYLKNDQQFSQLAKLLVTDIWGSLTPLISQLDEALRQFNHLRQNLTMQEYKISVDTGIIGDENPYPSSTERLDQLIHNWIELGKVSGSKFNERFKISAEKLQNHYDLITPAILDHNLPRTTSRLENFFGRIKQFLRKWSGTSRILSTFDWIAPLVATRQSLKETDKFVEVLRDITAYDWVLQSIKLGKELGKRRFRIRFANSVANKSPQGLVNFIDNLVMRAILG